MYKIVHWLCEAITESMQHPLSRSQLSGRRDESMRETILSGKPVLVGGVYLEMLHQHAHFNV